MRDQLTDFAGEVVKGILAISLLSRGRCTPNVFPAAEIHWVASVWKTCSKYLGF